VQSPSSQNPKLLNSGPDNELNSTLDTAPHPHDLWEQHPIRASATNLTAPSFNMEETGNIEGNCLRVNSLQSPSRTLPPEFKFGAHSPSPGFQFGVTVSTSYVAEGTIFNFSAVDESNTDIDTWRGVRSTGAIPSIDTCNSHSSDPTPRVIHTKLPHFGDEEDASDSKLSLILATNRLSIQDAARRFNVRRAHFFVRWRRRA